MLSFTSIQIISIQIASQTVYFKKINYKSIERQMMQLNTFLLIIYFPRDRYPAWIEELLIILFLFFPIIHYNGLKFFQDTVDMEDIQADSVDMEVINTFSSFWFRWKIDQGEVFPIIDYFPLPNEPRHCEKVIHRYLKNLFNR